MPVNKRDEARWALIEPHVELHGKTILDVGCGMGDVLMRCCLVGAKLVHGVDHDNMVVAAVTERLAGCPGVSIFEHDVQQFLSRSRRKYDVGFCLSVLPYVSMEKVLDLLRRRVRMAFVECQYQGDGPAATVRDDEEMASILEATKWASVERLGTVPVAIRRAERTVWLCLSD